MMRPEHVALNVPDPLAMVEWYKRNLNMTVKRAGGPPTHTTFFADVSGNILLELFSNTDFPMLELGRLHPMSLHLAFMTDDIESTKRAMGAAGATLEEDVTKIPTGDLMLMMRDPWGFALQFAQRSSPMLKNVHLRPEHVAFNVPDSRSQAQWYQDHLGMIVKREGGAPTFGRFISDAHEHMMVEFYQNTDYPMIDLPSTSCMAVHFAWMVPDVGTMRAKMLAAGAKVDDEMTTIPSGDVVLMMRDPWGLPIQFVKRVQPML
jgi:catechol 2,3-dioxygenase-like lactoylglutathione lyase family enzyme